MWPILVFLSLLISFGHHFPVSCDVLPFAESLCRNLPCSRSLSADVARVPHVMCPNVIGPPCLNGLQLSWALPTGLCHWSQAMGLGWFTVGRMPCGPIRVNYNYITAALYYYLSSPFFFLIFSGKDDEKTRSTFQALLRALCYDSQHSSISSYADSVFRSLSGDSYAAAGVFLEATIAAGAVDVPGGICVVAVRDFAGFDALWLGYVFYWIHVDALGYWIGNVPLCGWDCVHFVDAGTRDSLSHHVTAEERGSRSRKGIYCLLLVYGAAIHLVVEMPLVWAGQMKGGVINSICRYCMGSITKCCMSAHWHGNSCDGRSELVRAHVGGFSSTIVLFLGGVLPLAM
ncbi:hypothetical protein TEA_005898 [Camellia sinensis var. sinensis]|uniref:Uncharacterized protein n=1 Tax=Camellia sinensis var. sinensis TaxID=542762 RepID=A0A4S4E6K5_CAMSN|nr:hypothetical protein TEA_005898 [Camellia sinensis var. sinensis]